MPTDAELRKAARANAPVRVFRAGEEEAQADADAVFWDKIPVNERAQFVWKLSLELHTLAHRSAWPSCCKTKRASARPQDLADVAALERLQRLKR
jgi:hypothetical protein